MNGTLKRVINGRLSFSQILLAGWRGNLERLTIISHNCYPRHGYYCKYLFKMGKMARSNCIYCDTSIDDAERTFFHYQRWRLERWNLEAKVGAVVTQWMRGRYEYIGNKMAKQTPFRSNITVVPNWAKGVHKRSTRVRVPHTRNSDDSPMVWLGTFNSPQRKKRCVYYGLKAKIFENLFMLILLTLRDFAERNIFLCIPFCP